MNYKQMGYKHMGYKQMNYKQMDYTCSFCALSWLTKIDEQVGNFNGESLESLESFQNFLERFPATKVSKF